MTPVCQPPVRAVSVVILTQDEEAMLPACLASLEGLDAEVFVVDSGSTDRTVEIARQAGATVIQHPFEHYGAQRNWALGHLPLRGAWVLHLDADERLTPELVREMSAAVRAAPRDVAGFLLRRRTVFMGRWIRHGGHYPSYQLRLFRLGQGRCEDRLYDQHFLVEGTVRSLRHDYIDVVTSDVSTWSRRHLRWAEAEAAEVLAASPAGGRVPARLLGGAVERRRWLRTRLFQRAPLFARAFAYWGYRYVLRLGFLDGVEGLVFHFLQGCWYRVLVDTHIHAARRRGR